MIILATKPVPLVSLVVNPLTGNVDMVLCQEAVDMFGPIYPSMLRQQLENALKTAEQLEKSIYIKEK